MTFYVPQHFRVGDHEALERFVREHAFGTMVSSGPAGLAASHLPFLAERGADGRLRLLGHLARANPHWRELEAAPEVLVIFHGPHAYVSPSWYQVQPSVPTWNYAVAHARGTARLLPESAHADLLDRLSRAYEDARPQPWRMDGLPADYQERMLRAIVGFEIEVASLTGKFKLSQNRARADIDGVAGALEESGQAELAAMMREAADREGESR